MSASRCSMTKGASGSARPPRVASSSASRPRPAVPVGSVIQGTSSIAWTLECGELRQLLGFCLGEANLDLAFPHARFKARLHEHRRPLDHRAGANVEAGAMPRAGDGVALARALSQ